MKPRLLHIGLSMMLNMAPVLAFAQEHDHAGEAAPAARTPNPVAVQMLVLPVVIVLVLAYNAFRKRK